MFSVSVRAQDPCDLTHDGTVDFADVNLALSIVVGPAPCTADLQHLGGCNVVAVQRVINTALGGTCTSSHSVTLTWVASTSTNVTGYNVYRTSTLGGIYIKLNSTQISGLTYADNTVQPGQTYYYVATAVDDTNSESAFSNLAQASVPSP